MVLPVSLIQDHNLVPPWLQSDLLLRKHLDLVPHHIQPPAKHESTIMHIIHTPPKAAPDRKEKKGTMAATYRPRR